MSFRSLILSLFPQKDFILELHHTLISTGCQSLLAGKIHVRQATTETAAGADTPPCTCKRPCSWSSGALPGLWRWVDLTAGSADAALVSDVLCVSRAWLLSPCPASPWHEPRRWIYICCLCEQHVKKWWQCLSASEGQKKISAFLMSAMLLYQPVTQQPGPASLDLKKKKKSFYKIKTVSTIYYCGKGSENMQ